MFEDSTFESMGVIRTRSRGWMLATFALNGSILLALILIPLVYPEALPGLSTSFLIEAPPPPAEAPRPQPMPAHATAVHVQTVEAISFPSQIPKQLPPNEGPEVSHNINLAEGDSIGTGAASPDNPWSSQHPVVVVQQPRTPAKVSQGVMNGLRLNNVVPPYPPIAKAAGTEGTVVLQATISKSGTIENLRVVSGPQLLQQAALDAVRQWDYRPYLLNGEPIEVETTVNVVFKLH
jgi:protein TonB